EIGELVLKQLSCLSEVAYIRFASVYRQFRGIRDFVDTLEDLRKEDLQSPSAETPETPTRKGTDKNDYSPQPVLTGVSEDLLTPTPSLS
ncbi:MAG: hypothetical protein ACRCT1_21090, partial [Microcoleaceae cyanobacterium]